MKQQQKNACTLRWATAADIDAVVAFDAAHLHASANGQPNPRIANRIRAWMDGSHPLARAEDVTVVVDDATGQIVSSQALMRQPWRFAGIPLDVGQVEFVATHRDYRRRGLVRQQMEMMHERCVERGWLVQAITGIPAFYRQFGYEFALEKGGGWRASRTDLEDVAKRATHAYRVRIADAADIPFLISADLHAQQRSLVSCERDTALWQYELTGRTAPNMFLTHVCIIESRQGVPVGYLVHPPQASTSTSWVDRFEVSAEIAWIDVTPDVVRYLLETWAQDAVHIGFWLGSNHPIYELLPRTLTKRYAPDAWYVRVPDLAAFLNRVKPVLQERLASSAAAGYSGTITLNFFSSGLRLTIEKGQIAVERWSPLAPRDGDARFPANSFLPLLFGNRSLAELEDTYADCQVDEEMVWVVLNQLFPKQPSSIWWIG